MRQIDKTIIEAGDHVISQTMPYSELYTAFSKKMSNMRQVVQVSKGLSPIPILSPKASHQQFHTQKDAAKNEAQAFMDALSLDSLASLEGKRTERERQKLYA